MFHSTIMCLFIRFSHWKFIHYWLWITVVCVFFCFLQNVVFLFRPKCRHKLLDNSVPRSILHRPWRDASALHPWHFRSPRILRSGLDFNVHFGKFLLKNAIERSVESTLNNSKLLLLLVDKRKIFTFQILHACMNLTTNEMFNYKRYSYLRDKRGKYCNPFSRGPFFNFIEFFLSPPNQYGRDVQNYQSLSEEMMWALSQIALAPKCHIVCFSSILHIFYQSSAEECTGIS